MQRINHMENHDNSTGRAPKEGWFSAIVHLILSYYAELITHPFKTGLVYFAAGLIGVLFVGWILFPMVLYSSQKQPVDFPSNNKMKIADHIQVENQHDGVEKEDDGYKKPHPEPLDEADHETTARQQKGNSGQVRVVEERT